MSVIHTLHPPTRDPSSLRGQRGQAGGEGPWWSHSLCRVRGRPGGTGCRCRRPSRHSFLTKPTQSFSPSFPRRLFWLQDRLEQNSRDLTHKRTINEAAMLISGQEAVWSSAPREPAAQNTADSQTPALPPSQELATRLYMHTHTCVYLAAMHGYTCMHLYAAHMCMHRHVYRCMETCVHIHAHVHT